MDNRIERIKIHFKKHKLVYSCAVTGVVVAGITVLIMRSNNSLGGWFSSQRGVEAGFLAKPQAIVKELHAVLDAGADCPEKESVDSFIFNFGRSIFGSISNENNVVTTVHKGVQGHPGFITRCVETGELFATQGAAAKAYNIPEEFLSKHLNHGKELAEGIHFERVGILSV